MRAFRELLAALPGEPRSATLIQIASPSREDVGAYGDIRRELESLCGAINGDFGELDWMPVRYIHRTVARKRLPGLYRASRVGAGDAAARRHEPGRQGIRRGAGPGRPGRAGAVAFRRRGRAAEGSAAGQSLRHAGTAEAIQQALQMPLEERRQRHQTLMQTHPRARRALVARQLPGGAGGDHAGHRLKSVGDSTLTRERNHKADENCDKNQIAPAIRPTANEAIDGGP